MLSGSKLKAPSNQVRMLITNFFVACATLYLFSEPVTHSCLIWWVKKEKKSPSLVWGGVAYNVCYTENHPLFCFIAAAHPDFPADFWAWGPGKCIGTWAFIRV